MNIEAYRELRLLTEISSDVSATQRRLAKRQGLALGLTNLLIRRLARKGYITVVNLKRNRLRYLITPQGLSEKARLTYEYIEYTLYFYRQIRAFLTSALAAMRPSNGTNILLYGTGEVAEIAFLVLQQNGFSVVAVVDGYVNGGAFFMNQPVRSLAELPTLSFDWVLVAALKDRAQTVELLRQWGIPRDQIIAIPDEQTAEFGTINFALHNVSPVNA